MFGVYNGFGKRSSAPRRTMHGGGALYWAHQARVACAQGRTAVRPCRSQGNDQAALTRNRLSRRALLTTVTDDRPMAAAAKIGLNSRPKNGYSTPAATGMSTVL